MAKLRLFASAREAAGVASVELSASTVAEILEEASKRFGEPFVSVLARSKVWRNGEPTLLEEPIDDNDEIAILPPVSGGAHG